MNQDWEPGTCNEKSGFLFSHPCDRFDTARCVYCAKPVCDEHTVPSAEGSICVTCAKSAPGQDEQYDDQDAGNYHRGGRRSYGRGYHYHDPYFYGGHYYSDYGRYGGRRWGHRHHNSSHDDNDFTEADAQSFAHQDNEDFESDLGES